MDWLKTVAPTIATCLGGPLGGLAYEAISKVMGISQDDAQKMMSDGKLTSDQIASLQQAEIALKAQALALNLDFEQLAVQDRASARSMQMNTHSFLVPTLALVIVASFIATIFGTLMGYSHIESAMAGTLVGYLSAKAEQVVAFYFGSSAGSQAKDVMLHQSTPTKL
jgi:energy-converting hydrogenase Eha subunit A